METTQMTTAQIKQCIANWTAILNNVPALETAFAQGNSFDYHFPVNNLGGSLSIHAYPGLKDGNLYFFLIPSAFDVSTCTDIAAHTAVCPILLSLGSNRIPAKEAKKRIDRWKDFYKTWIPQQVKSEFGMMQAFVLEVQDFEVTRVKINLGLTSDFQVPPTYTADLIVTNVDQTAVYYDDFSKPVPPYGTGPAAAQSNFYLIDANAI